MFRSVSTSEAVPLEYMKLNASKTSFHSDGDADTDPDVFPTPPPATNETQWGGPEATPDQGVSMASWELQFTDFQTLI